MSEEKIKAIVIVCVVITLFSIVFALKKYVDMLIIIFIMQSKGIEISDTEFRSTSTYIVKKLLKF